eukprot:6186376-Pleurochrysis_carterae.AAC.8
MGKRKRNKHEDESGPVMHVTGFVQDGELLLRDEAGVVYQSERDWLGELVPVGQWDPAMSKAKLVSKRSIGAADADGGVGSESFPSRTAADSSVIIDDGGGFLRGQGGNGHANGGGVGWPIVGQRDGDPQGAKARTEELTREIATYARAKQLRKSVDTFQQLISEGLRPNGYTIYFELRFVSFAALGGDGVVGREILWRALLDGSVLRCSSSKVDASPIPPCRYSNMINAFVNSGDVAGATRMLSEMVDSGFKPNVVVHTTILKVSLLRTQPVPVNAWPLCLWIAVQNLRWNAFFAGCNPG